MCLDTYQDKGAYMKNNSIYTMTLSAMLCAIGIIIPMFSPIKIMIEPASFTLASHVAIMIAMFISPQAGIAVTLGTTLGFFLGGFPPVVVLRALSQIIFITIGALMLKKKPEIMKNFGSMVIFCLGIGIIHATAEVLVSLPFYFANGITATATSGFLYSVFVLVGIGTLIHSCVDFTISVVLWKFLVKSPDIKKVASIKELAY